jgi:uncharacterized membrane protein
VRTSQTYYDLLDVPANAPAERIRESYHVLASVWHPDRFAQGSKQHQLATRKLREINAAYEVLKNPQRRAEYDRRLIEERRVSGVYWKLRAQGNYGPPPGLPNLPALLAYVFGPMAVVFLLIPTYRRDRFVSFNAWQSILFAVTAYVATVVGPWVGLQRPIYWVLWMTGVTLYWMFLMKQAYQNRLYLIPGLGQLAARRSGLNEVQFSELKAPENR